MRQLSIFTAFAFLGLPILSWAEPDTNVVGQLDFSAYNEAEDGPFYGAEGGLYLTVDELSPTIYQYGTYLSVEFDQTVTDVEEFNARRFRMKEYGIYYGIAQYRATFATDLSLDQSPTTHLSFGEGIVSQWSGIQPFRRRQGLCRPI